MCRSGWLWLTLRVVGVVGLAAALTACAGRPQPYLYAWGNYESLLYKAYSEPGQLPVEAQLQDLEEHLRQAEAANRPVPPGYLAHLGYLRAQLGEDRAARAYFEREKRAYPESRVYMDRLIQQLKPSAS